MVVTLLDIRYYALDVVEVTLLQVDDFEVLVEIGILLQQIGWSTGALVDDIFSQDSYHRRIYINVSTREKRREKRGTVS